MPGFLKPKTTRPYKKRVYKRKPKSSMRSVTSMVKSISLAQTETKRSTRHAENINLSHNVTYYIDNLFKTEEGQTNPSGTSIVNNRIGNEVIARGLAIKLWISNKVDRPNVMYKVLLLEHPTRLISSTMNDTVVWQGVDGLGGTMNRMIDHVASNRVKVVKSFTLQPNKESNYSQNPVKYEKSRLLDFYVPLKNRKIWYNTDNGVVASFKDMALAIVAYDAYGTLQTDILASFAYNIRFYFKDP